MIITLKILSVFAGVAVIGVLLNKHEAAKRKSHIPMYEIVDEPIEDSPVVLQIPASDTVH